MNPTALILDILFVIIAAIFIVVGVRRGFIKSLIKSAKLLLTIIATYFLGSPVAAFIRDKFVFKGIYDFVYEKTNGIYESVNGSFEAFREGIASRLLELVPEFLLKNEKKEEILNAIPEEDGVAMVESVSTSLANPIADVISNILGYVLTFVLAFVVLTIAAWLLTKLADHIAFIGTANRILGGVFGALMGIIVLMIIAVIVNFIDAKEAVYPDTVIVKLLGDFLK